MIRYHFYFLTDFMLKVYNSLRLEFPLRAFYFPFKKDFFYEVQISGTFIKRLNAEEGDKYRLL